MSSNVVALPLAPQANANEKEWKLVVHQRPDTDAWACLWAAARFVVPRHIQHLIIFVRAGERLPPEEEEGFEVLYMDTGLGDLDQHGKMIERGSSFELLVRQHALDANPGILPILELTKATDNVEQISWTSVHYYFKGLPHLCRDSNGQIDWNAISDRVFEVFDVLYGQAVNRAESRKRFAEKCKKPTRLVNGIYLVHLANEPALREAAYEAGADVIVFTQHKKHGMDVVIQVNRHSRVSLELVAAALRRNEAQVRGTSYTLCTDLRQVGNDPIGSKWFLHDTKQMVCCGTRGHPLEKGEYTMLSEQTIVNLVVEALSAQTR